MWPRCPIDERLIEVDYGEYDGTPLGDLPHDLVNRWRTDPNFAPPGGESLASVRVRMAEFSAELLDSLAAGPVVAVSHVSPIKAAVLWGARPARRLRVAPAPRQRVGHPPRRLAPTARCCSRFNER